MTALHSPQDSDNPSPLSANLPHRPADDSEEVYFEGSPLLRGAIGNAIGWEIAGLALILVPLLTEFYFHQHIPALIYVGIVIVGLVFFCVPPLRARTIRYRVTNYRIDYERGLISKDIDTMELWHVEDIQYHQTARDRLLGIGSIAVIAHDMTTPKLVMRSLPNSKHLFDQLKTRIIAVKRQRGVIKLDSGT